jgi:hypothetical protein
MKKVNMIFAFIVMSTALLSCSNADASIENNVERNFGIFKVLDDDKTIEMDGAIGSASLTNFNNLEAAFPTINKINIIDCEGSSDDEINLLLSPKVHQKGIDIHLTDNGEIASGGVDFFIAGIRRTKGSNTGIGVHSWSDGNASATDFPVGNANHLPYINYYG